MAGDRGRSLNRACILVLSAALLASPLWGHIDDTDAHLYQVLGLVHVVPATPGTGICYAATRPRTTFE
jgi:hypothetical protein